jgi:hypothetical protein
VINPDKLNNCEDSLYTIDRRLYANKPARKSLIKKYDRNKNLRRINQIPRDKINTNPYSQRIEFCLAKYNCPYRTINNINGSYNEIIARYIPYLAIIYHKYLYGNMIVDTREHPFFDMIYKLAGNNRCRYTGNLEKTVPHHAGKSEEKFYQIVAFNKINRPDISPEELAVLAMAFV